jgi:DNA-binding LacI/PurR family transcriptional regulator
MSISEVAKLAGVSSATVSRVINNHPRVAPKTAQSVRAAMQNLGYTPSDRRPGPKPMPHARRTARAIAFLVLGTSRTRATPAFQDLLRGVSIGAARHELNLNFHHVADPQHPPLRAIEQGIDGVLLHGAVPIGEARERLRHLPTVWLMGNVKRPDWGDQVLPDAYQIGEIAAKYLLERGHKRLAFFNLEAGHWSLRIYGHAFQMTAQDLGAHVDRLERAASATSTEYWHDHSVEAVDALVKQYLALSPRPTGIFVADDMQVAMLQPALQKHGVELGPDAAGGRVDVISCNNEQPYLVGLQPRPAVVDIRVESIGRRGIEQLLWRLDHPEVTERIITAIEPSVIKPEDAARAQRIERAGK